MLVAWDGGDEGQEGAGAEGEGEWRKMEIFEMLGGKEMMELIQRVQVIRDKALIEVVG